MTGDILVQIGAGILLFALGAGFTWYFWRQAQNPSSSWPTVQARITDTGVREVLYRDEATESKLTVWRPFLAYTYEREGKTFTAHVVRFQMPEGFASTPDECETIASRYRGLRETKVYVSPFDPSVSLVEPVPPETGMVAVVACAFLALVGLGLAAEAVGRVA